MFGILILGVVVGAIAGKVLARVHHMVNARYHYEVAKFRQSFEEKQKAKK